MNRYNLTKELQKAVAEDSEKREPIYKGCKNKTCFCTNACKEVIGWKDKKTGNVEYVSNPLTDYLQ